MKIIECPRDAMQGIEEFIPTDLKAKYINQLLKVGFDTIDFGSFVSPKAVPQMSDTAEVLSKLDFTDTDSKLLAIIANQRGAEDALSHTDIDYLGYPLSISETFQQRNTNKGIVESLNMLENIQSLTESRGKTLVVYLSMGFGNPYDDPYHTEMVIQFSDILHSLGIRIVSLADTIGSSTPEQIIELFTKLIPAYPDIEFGAHLHSTPEKSNEKIKAVVESGCTRMDGALKGFGGCPFAKDDLTGNLATEIILKEIDDQAYNHKALNESIKLASEVF